MMQSKQLWSEVDERISLEMFADRKNTFSIIGKAIGKSRSAVAGHFRRNGIFRTLPKLSPNLTMRQVRDRDNAARRAVRAAVRGKFLSALTTSEAPLAPVDVEKYVTNVRLHDLTIDGCKYPSGTSNYTFCNAPRHGGRAYCPDHAALVYQPSRGRR